MEYSDSRSMPVPEQQADATEQGAQLCAALTNTVY